MSLLLASLLVVAGLASSGPLAPTPAPAPLPIAAVAHSAPPALTIRNVACPVSYTGPDFAADCHSPVANMEFTLALPPDVVSTGLTDPAGIVSFTGLAADLYEIRGGPPGEFVENAIACHLTADPTVAVPYFPQDNQTIRLAITTDLSCDWFSAPEDLRGEIE